ncbi:MAG TPA: hypothetical protein VGM05_06400 [Planctomycetaceae bacterium]
MKDLAQLAIEKETTSRACAPTLLEGPAGAGKSFLALDLVSRLCDDHPCPECVPHSRNGAKRLIPCRIPL